MAEAYGPHFYIAKAPKSPEIRKVAAALRQSTNVPLSLMLRTRNGVRFLATIAITSAQQTPDCCWHITGSLKDAHVAICIDPNDSRNNSVRLA